MGDSNNNLLIGSSAGDILTGGSGNDYIVGGGGNDVIDGGSGTDVAVYSGNPTDYDITHNTDGSWTVADVRGSASDGTDTLKNVEFIQFSDGTKYALQANGILDQTDFSFVIDTTGSMEPYLGAVQADATALVNSIFSGGNTDAHINVISFKDPQAGYPDSVVLPFTTQTNFADRQTAAVNAINSLTANGGGDIPEGDNSGLLLALNGSSGEWRYGADIRRIVLFTDAPVKDTYLAATVEQYAHDLGTVINSSSAVPSTASSDGIGISLNSFKLAASAAGASPEQVNIYTVQVGYASYATASIQQIATDNNGKFLQAPTPDDLVAALTSVVSAIQIEGAVSGQAIDDTSTITPFAGVTVSDPTAGETETLTVTPSVTTNGTFANLGSGTVDSLTGAYSVVGSAEAVTSALEELVFIPASHEVAPGGTVTTTFTITDTNSDSVTASDSNTSVIVTATAPCFTAGTRIRTPRGKIPVEKLRIGNLVNTMNDGKKRIKWIGTRSYEGRFCKGNPLVLPILIKQHAIADNIPSRDLYVSPDHAICEGGILIPARCLVNGSSIIQMTEVESVMYYHIELERHDVVFAEDCPTETFRDVGCRNRFHNAASYCELYPEEEATQEPCLPWFQDGFYLHVIWSRIAARASAFDSPVSVGPMRGFLDEVGIFTVRGWAQDMSAPEEPVCLDVYINGYCITKVLANRHREDLRQAGIGSGKHSFELQLPFRIFGNVEVRRSFDQAVLAFSGIAAARVA